MAHTDLSRRHFLAAAGLGSIGVALSRAEGAPTEPTKSPATELPVVAPLDQVNLLQGNDSVHVYSRGNTLPIAALPFGVAHWTLQNRTGTGVFFQPGDCRLQGFRCTHQLSPWLNDYGQASFLPVCGEVALEPAKRASSYRPDRARLSPYSLSLFLSRFRIQTELVPTERCAVIRAAYELADTPGFVFDAPGEVGEVVQASDRTELRFASAFHASGKPEEFSTFYVVRFSRAWETVSVKAGGGGRTGLVHFSDPQRSLEIRIGTSFISYEQAQVNLDRELSHHSVDEIRARAVASWNEHFSRIEVGAGPKDAQRIFYSCLYRALLFPRQWHEIDASGRTVHRSAYTGKVEDGVMYADHGYWDVYRAWYPWMAVVFPERLGEILQGWVNVYREGGWLPQFPAPGYRACMTGSLIDAVFGDAACKGIGGFDLGLAFDGLVKHATQPGNPKAGYGRQGIEDYLKLGYVPADRPWASAAETTDAAYGDFCIAQVARALGRDADAKAFMVRSENWRHLFDGQTGFIRGKNADGSWLEPFDPISWGGAYVEGAAWQHRWDVPHNVDGLFAALGGPKKAVELLEEMLRMAPAFRIGTYSTEIHEMSEMAASDFGQYAHSNQPVHHILYLFAAAGRPDRTRYWVNRVLTEMYTPDAFPGDEDTGSMAAWYLLSASGFYAACPGRPDYTLGEPLFDRVTLRRPGKPDFVISRRGATGKLAKIRLNGVDQSGPTIAHKALAEGGRLEFVYA